MTGYPVEKRENEARAAGTFLPVSKKESVLLAKKLRGLTVEEAKRFLEELGNGDRNINNKHYTKTAKHMREVIESAEKNGEDQGLGELQIRTISAEKPSRRASMRRTRKGGRSLKHTHLKVVLQEIKGTKPAEESQDTQTEEANETEEEEGSKEPGQPEEEDTSQESEEEETEDTDGGSADESETSEEQEGATKGDEE